MIPHDVANELKQTAKDIVHIAKGNDAIAEMMGFKNYIPSETVLKSHENIYAQYNLPMRWYVVPGIGRYNSFELRFHCDWDWLVSAIIEMKKYRAGHTVKPITTLEQVLQMLWHQLEDIKPIDFDKKVLWVVVSQYALTLKLIKEQEK